MLFLIKSKGTIYYKSKNWKYGSAGIVIVDSQSELQKIEEAYAVKTYTIVIRWNFMQSDKFYYFLDLSR